jgi:hypothetical protein
MLSNVLDTFHVVYLRSHPKVLLHLGIPHCRHVLHLQFAVDQTTLDLVPMKKRKAKERKGRKEGKDREGMLSAALSERGKQPQSIKA